MTTAIAGPGGGMGSMLGSGDKRGKANDLYRQNRDWPYVFIQAIARRIGGLAYGAGTITKQAEKSTGFAATKALANQRMDAMKLPNSIKQRTSNGRAIEQVETHPALDFLQRPNKIQGKVEFLQCTILNLFLTGEAYWIGGKVGEGKFELWAIPTSWIIPKHDGGLFTSYVMKLTNQEGEGTPLPAELVRRMYLPDPQDFKSSISPVAAEAKAVKIDEHIQSSQLEMFEQGILPQLMVTVGEVKGPDGQSLGQPSLTGPQRKQIVKAVREIINSAVRNRDPLIVDALIANVEKMSHNAAEMDYLQSGDAVKKRISQAFGMNPIIVGEMQGVNRAQAAVADQSYVDNVVNPLGDKITCALQDFVVPMFDGDNEVTTGLALWLEEARPKDDELDLRRIQQARADGAASINEHRRVTNLAPIESPAADLTGPCSTPAGKAQLIALIAQVSAGQIPANVAQDLMVRVLGISEADAKDFLKGVKPQPQPGGFPGQGPPGGPPQGGGGGAGPPKPVKPPQSEKPDPDDQEDPDKPDLPKIDSQPAKRLKFSDDQARDESGRWADGGGSGGGSAGEQHGNAEEIGVFTWRNFKHGSEHVAVGDDGKIKLKNPKTPEAASAMLHAMNQIMDKATADLDAAMKQNHNEMRVQTSVRLGGVRKALSKAIGYARKIVSAYKSNIVADLESLIDELISRWKVKPIDPDDDDEQSNKAIARIVGKAAAAPRLTRSVVKSHISRQRSALESEAAVGLIPFFNRSLSGPLDSLLSEAITSTTPITRQPSQPV